MLRLKLVKTADVIPIDDGLLHGTAIIKFLVLPWRVSGGSALERVAEHCLCSLK
jgi:hypothetical protein